MSILASLAKAYERLSCTICPSDIPLEQIGICISLMRTVGGASAMWDHDQGKKRTLTQDAVPVPYNGGRHQSKAFFLWDNTAYVLGVTGKPKVRTGEAMRTAFKSIIEVALANADDAGLNSGSSLSRNGTRKTSPTALVRGHA